MFLWEEMIICSVTTIIVYKYKDDVIIKVFKTEINPLDKHAKCANNISMFLLNEYSRNILHHVRPQTVASRERGQTKTAKMNEKFIADADKNECSSKFLL